MRIGLHILLAIGLVVVATIVNWITILYAEMISKSWMAPLNLKAKDNGSTELIVSDELQRQTNELNRIKEQLDEVRSRTTSHLQVMKFFFTRYYAAIVLISIAGAGAAATLVSITQTGWSHSNEFTLTIFFVTTAIAVFYRAVPASFQQQKNITDNKALFLKYWALENEIRSFVVTGYPMNRLADSDKPTVKDFIRYIDQQLAQDNIALGFDEKSAPDYRNVFDVSKT
ncbi:MAG: hypothetical protein WCF57_09910 [Pyrinomonadaceae bacterium]